MPATDFLDDLIASSGGSDDQRSSMEAILCERHRHSAATVEYALQVLACLAAIDGIREPAPANLPVAA